MKLRTSNVLNVLGSIERKKERGGNSNQKETLQKGGLMVCIQSHSEGCLEAD